MTVERSALRIKRPTPSLYEGATRKSPFSSYCTVPKTHRKEGRLGRAVSTTPWLLHPPITSTTTVAAWTLEATSRRHFGAWPGSACYESLTVILWKAGKCDSDCMKTAESTGSRGLQNKLEFYELLDMDGSGEQLPVTTCVRRF